MLWLEWGFVPCHKLQVKADFLVMDKKILKEVILEQAEFIQKRDLGIGREALNQIARYLKLPHVIVVSGIRRSGKSTLLGQIIRKYYDRDAYYFNFEDERLVDFELDDFNYLYELFLELYGEKKIFFFDEIQNVKSWEIFVRRMYDRGFKFFITGSNASLLEKEIGTRLTGRYLLVNLFPFSFREFLSFKGYHPGKDAFFVTKERGRLKRFFNEYLKIGGMPEYLKYKEREILERNYEDILYRDIIVRNDVKEVKALRELAIYLLSNAASLFTYNKMKIAFGLGSVNTAKSYVDYLENSFLLYVINMFSYSLKQQMFTPKKAYCVDNGILNIVSFRFSENKGRFMENLVFIELLRRGKEIYYYKTEKGMEVDFLVRKGNRISELIQVTSSLKKETVKDREVKALVTALTELKMKKGIILTEDEEEEFSLKGKTISVTPVYKWLLTKL